MADEDFEHRLFAATAEMACGMLAFQDRLQVLEDLRPSHITLPDEQIETACRTMDWLRGLPFSSAARLLVSQVPAAIAQLRTMMVADWLWLQDLDTRNPDVPARFADAVLCLALGNVADKRYRQGLEEIDSFDEIIKDADRMYDRVKAEVFRRTGLEL